MSGCADSPYHRWAEESRIQEINALSSKTPEQQSYESGSINGCDSGANASGNYAKSFYKDVNKYIKDVYYKSGWDDGFAKCKAQGEMINNVINKSI